MKVAPAVSPHDLDLSIHSFNEVGGGEGFAHVLGIFQKRQIVLPFLAEFADPGRIGLGETITEFFKLAVADVDIPGGFDGAPPLHVGKMGKDRYLFGPPRCPDAHLR